MSSLVLTTSCYTTFMNLVSDKAIDRYQSISRTIRQSALLIEQYIRFDQGMNQPNNVLLFNRQQFYRYYNIFSLIAPTDVSIVCY